MAREIDIAHKPQQRGGHHTGAVRMKQFIASSVLQRATNYHQYCALGRIKRVRPIGFATAERIPARTRTEISTPISIALLLLSRPLVIVREYVGGEPQQIPMEFELMVKSKHVAFDAENGGQSGLAGC
jgi:hypothetical protein